MAIAPVGTVNFLALPVIGYGVVVALGDVDGDGFTEIGATPGPGPAHDARYVGYDYDGAVIAALPGFDVTTFATPHGGRIGIGMPAPDGREELLCGAGPDPAADAIAVAFRYTPGQSLERIVSFAAFSLPPLAYGVDVAAGKYGY